MFPTALTHKWSFVFPVHSVEGPFRRFKTFFKTPFRHFKDVSCLLPSHSWTDWKKWGETERNKFFLFVSGCLHALNIYKKDSTVSGGDPDIYLYGYYVSLNTLPY